MSERRTNRLGDEVSPYLQQHAHNPVEWWPWSAEALATAVRHDKPILLSIGYSACHWCHVMERECFEDEAIAAQMNDGFVCVKVDREERPDLDQVYQLVVQLLGKSGGWPLTVFLTPDQKPFFGGTYFPPADKYGVPGFPRIMTAVLEAFRAKRGEIDAQATEVTDAIAGVTTHETRVRADDDARIDAGIVGRAAQKLGQRFDDRNGGFGSRPKFPSTMSVALLLRHGMLDRDDASLGRARFTLDRMRAGGVYDQLGGGFHRYSTDAEWLVPHFEKMLYDNALLLRLYVDGWRATRDERLAQTAREIAIYLGREMTSADGGFFATQDADSEGEEGRFFVWTPESVRAALGADEDAAAAAIARWGVTAAGNFEETGSSVLHEATSLADLAVRLGRGPSAVEDALVRARAKLLVAREKRPRPFRDEKVLASWNGLAIGALADAGAALGDRAMIASAQRAFAFLERVLLVERAGESRVKRLAKDGVAKGEGFLDDHAFVADAALDLFEVTGETRYLTCAIGLARTMESRFGDDAASGFFFSPSDGEALIHRAKDLFDHAVPSATSIACKVLLRLGAIAHPRYGERAARTLEALAGPANGNPFGFGETLAALDRLARGSVDVVIAGDRSVPEARALADVVFRAYVPNRNVVWLGDEESRRACAVIADGKVPGPGGAPRAYVCRDRTCTPPLDSADALSRELTA